MTIHDFNISFDFFTFTNSNDISLYNKMCEIAKKTDLLEYYDENNDNFIISLLEVDNTIYERVYSFLRDTYNLKIVYVMRFSKETFDNETIEDCIVIQRIDNTLDNFGIYSKLD